MATELAKAYVQIIPSADGIKGKLTSALGGEATSAGTNAGSSMASSAVAAFGGMFIAGVLAAATTAAAGIVTITKNAIEEGAGLEQSIGGIETLFKDSSDAVLKNAENAYKTAGLSANEYMETATSFSASLLQGLAGDTEEAARITDMAITDMSDNANKMGTDMSLIQTAYQGFAKQNYTMLDNLKLGYGGTKGEMERLLADAKELAGIEYNIDNLADVYEAIHVIQEDIGITGTTAKEASETVSGSAASMKAAFSNVLGDLALGEDIEPSLEALGETVRVYLTENLIPMAGEILMHFPELITGGTDIITGLIESVDTDSILESGATLAMSLITAIYESVPELLESGGGLIKSILDSLGKIDDKDFEELGEKARPLMEQAGEWLGDSIDVILEELPGAIEVIGGLIIDYTDYAMDNSDDMMEIGKELLLQLLDGLIENGPDITEAAAELCYELCAEIGENLPEFLEAGGEIVGELLAGAVAKIPELMMALTVETPAKIRKEFEEYDWLEIGKNIIDGIGAGIKNSAEDMVEAATGVAGKALAAVKMALGIHSPSTAFEYVGEMMDLGLIKGVDNYSGLVTDTMNDLSSDTYNAFATAEYNFNAEHIEAAADYNGLSDKLAEGIAKSNIGEKIAEIIDEKIGELTVTIEGREFLRVEKSLA